MLKTLILFIFMLVVFFANAKDSRNDTIPRKIEFGITGGLTTTSISGYDKKVNIGSDNYYLFGITGQYNCNQMISIRGEINFERKGFVQMQNISTSKNFPDLFSFDYTDLDYIVVPLMAKVKFGPSKRFFVNGGPYLAYLVGGQHTLSTLDSLANWQQKTSNSYNDFKHFDLGANLGVGAEVPVLQKFIVSLEARSSFGFLNIGFPAGGKNYSLGLILSLRYIIK